jgi:hypothetical protein
MSADALIPRYVTLVAGAYALLGGLISFAGWWFDIARLADWPGSGIVMKANTALAVSAAGAALLIVAGYPAARRLIRGLAIFVAAVGGLTLFEHITAGRSSSTPCSSMRPRVRLRRPRRGGWALPRLQASC